MSAAGLVRRLSAEPVRAGGWVAPRLKRESLSLFSALVRDDVVWLSAGTIAHRKKASWRSALSYPITATGTKPASARRVYELAPPAPPVAGQALRQPVPTRHGGRRRPRLTRAATSRSFSATLRRRRRSRRVISLTRSAPSSLRPS